MDMICEKEKCSGCSACYAVCPVDAITMQQDEEGFLYPKINEEKCISCNLCRKTCQGRQQNNKKILTAYAVYNTNDDELVKSTSGGFSRILSNYVINNGGVVYGVAYNEHHEVVVQRANSLEACDAFYGSKYVQANPLESFSQVITDLKNNKLVLYIGTSCMIDGLLSLLKNSNISTNNLITVDLVCHGVPSPMLFKDYINFLKKKNNQFESFSFRTKFMPWGYGSINFGSTIFYKNGNKETNTYKSKIYQDLFFSNNCLRPHCHSCEYSSPIKPADFTIADYWGLMNEHPDFFSEKGVSAVLLHTDEAVAIFSKLKNMRYLETSIEKISKKQSNLFGPSPVSVNRDDFWKIYKEEGFVGIVKKYTNYNLKSFIKNNIKKSLMAIGLWNRN